MSTILVLKMLSDENDNFVRDYQIQSEATLADLHNYICKDLNYDSDNIVSMYTADEQWNKLSEYTLTDMGADDDPDHLLGDMATATMQDVLSQKHSRLIYQFDFINNRAFYIQLMDKHAPATDTHYPLVSLSEAEAPDQYDPQGSAEGGSVFDEMMSDFNDFEGDDNYDDE